MSTLDSKRIIRKINIMQVFYWMSFCAISGFATVYLLSKNITNSQIGFIIAMGCLLSVVTQFITGIVIDKYKKVTIKKVMLALFGLSTLAMLGVALFTKSGFLTSFMYCMAIVFLMSLQPLVTSFIYGYINEGVKTTFSFSRGIGSLMYAVFSFFMGQWLETHSTMYIPLLSAGFMLLLFLLVASMPEIESEEDKREVNEKEAPTSVMELHKKYPSFFLFFIGITFIFSFHAIINVFLPQIVYNVGGGDKQVGFAIALGAFCEIPVMFGFRRIEERFDVSKLLKVSGIFFFIKSILYLVAPSFMVIQLAQLLQTLSFALITPAYAHYINEWMAPKDRVKGQTFMMAGVTLGNVIGSLFGGQILDHANVHQLLICGSILAFIGMLLLVVSVKPITFLKQERE